MIMIGSPQPLTRTLLAGPIVCMLLLAVLPQANARRHGAALEKCACEAGEDDHPFAIDCSKTNALATAATKLTSCAKTKSACAAAGTGGLMACQQAFFVLQAHHSHCPHETLSSAQEKLVHDYESVCKSCEIFKPFNASLAGCAKVNCEDSPPLTLASKHVNSTCTNTSCCKTPEQLGGFRIIMAYHDQCDEDDVPTSVEELLHTVEESCEDHVCNSVDKTYNGKVCPTTAPTKAPTVAPTVDDHDDHDDEHGGHLWLDVLLLVIIAVLIAGIVGMVVKEKGGNPLFGGSDSDK